MAKPSRKSFGLEFKVGAKLALSHTKSCYLSGGGGGLDLNDLRSFPLDVINRRVPGKGVGKNCDM